MSNKHDDNAPISAQKFMNELRRYKRGSISRRQFLGVTGLATAMAVLGTTLPSLWPRKSHAFGELGDRLVFSTWPNYHNQVNLDEFSKMTGVRIQVNAFGSNEEMLAKLQAGATGWDVFVPTNYTISNYVELGLIQEMDLSRLPNYDASAHDPRFAGAATVNGKLYCVPKNWGTTGFIVNTKKIKSGPKSWKDFFDVTMGAGSGHTIVHDYQLTTIGAALCALGYSFNSIDSKELAAAEALLIKSKPHLFAITSDYQPGMRSGDGWMSICWNGDATQLKNDLPEMDYVIGTDGGEIWTDFYAIPKDAPHLDAAYAFINFMQDPYVQAREASVHGYAPTDSRAIALQPDSLSSNPILHPAAELMNGLEFGAAQTLTDPIRAELMARFKSA
ncbi:MAG: extracellular solute-binding protein [Gammaproteobacteria bacterium]|nr:extracellular solute-binding protein [Pseudomonadota bacterium]MCZ6734042.1 extracellular solute-binding protein [Gammaproteobacteria bacterium]